MIFIEKFREEDIDFLERWKNTYENENHIIGSKYSKSDRKRWIEKIKKSDDSIYWTINNGGIKIGIININHMDNEGCILEYYIGDTHFRGRNITKSILCTMYNYIFDELYMKYVIINVKQYDEISLKMHLYMGCEIKGRLKEGLYKDEKISDIVFVLMKNEKWNNIKEEFHCEQISIER